MARGTQSVPSNIGLATFLEEEGASRKGHIQLPFCGAFLDILEVVVQVNGNMNKITKLLVRAKE
jgi:hypothetical protein